MASAVARVLPALPTAAAAALPRRPAVAAPRPAPLARRPPPRRRSCAAAAAAGIPLERFDDLSNSASAFTSFDDLLSDQLRAMQRAQSEVSTESGLKHDATRVGCKASRPVPLPVPSSLLTPHSLIHHPPPLHTQVTDLQRTMDRRFMDAQRELEQAAASSSVRSAEEAQGGPCGYRWHRSTERTGAGRRACLGA